MALDLSFKPYSGVGIVTMYAYGAAVGFDLGEAPVFKISQSSPTDEMKTSRDVSRGVAYRLAQSKGASLEIGLNTLSDYTQGLLTSGTWSEQAAGSAVPAFVLPIGVQVGQVIKLPAENVSAVTVTDSTPATPKTLDADNYELDAFAGTIAIKDLTDGGAFVQPLKVAYTPGAVKVLGAFKAPDADFRVVLNGTNAYNGARDLVNVFKFRFAADGDSDWISESYGKWTLKGSVLIDQSRSAASAGGQYYSVTKPGA